MDNLCALPIESEGDQNSSQTERLEKLVGENTKILESWRLYLQPGSALRHLNIERQISELDPNYQPPNYKDWMFAASLEVIRLGILWPVIELGIKVYQAYSGTP